MLSAALDLNPHRRALRPQPTGSTLGVVLAIGGSVGRNERGYNRRGIALRCLLRAKSHSHQTRPPNPNVACRTWRR